MLLAAQVVVKFVFTEGFSAKKILEEDVTPTRLMTRFFDAVKIKASKFLGFQGQILRRESQVEFSGRERFIEQLRRLSYRQ